jgi:hypothetical protein
MSEIIEATPPAAGAAACGDEAVTSRPVGITALDLVRLAQGLYFIFWGLLLVIIVAGQILILPWLRTFAEFFLGVGMLAVLVGTWRLHQAKLDPAWRVSTRWTLTLAVLATYFCVIFYMWRKVPLHPYLQANALGFVACGIGYLIVLSGTMAALGRGLGRSDLARESRWFGGATVTFLLLPFLASLVYMVVMAVRNSENVLLQFHDLLGQLTVPVMLILLLPLSLTLGLVWAAKDATLRRLADFDGKQES